MEINMKRFFKLTVATLAIAASLSAHAVVLDVTFSGLVQSQSGSSFALNSPISGEFFFDTLTGTYSSFTIGDQAVAAGFTSSAAVTPDLYSALYEAQVSPVAQGGTSNSTFSLDLEGLSKWSSNDAVALLSDASQLSTNLDTGNSSFNYYTANSDGTAINSLNASLTSVQVSTVPEPTSLALMLAGIAALGLRRARRSKD